MLDAVIIVRISTTHLLPDRGHVPIRDPGLHHLPEGADPVALAAAAAGASGKAVASVAAAGAERSEESDNLEREESWLRPGLFLLLRWILTKTVI